MSSLYLLTQFYSNCLQSTNDPVSCSIRMGLHCLSICLCFGLTIACIIIIKNKYQRKRKFKHKAFLILIMCIVLQLSTHTILTAVFILTEFIGIRLYQLKILLQTVIFTEIFRYLYKKINKNQPEPQKWKNCVFYWSLFVINVSAGVVAILDIINEMNGFKTFPTLMGLYFIASALGNLLFLLFLAIVLDMIKRFRELAITNFKFNHHRTTIHFRKNQYLIQSLSLYFLTVLISSGVIKLPLNIYFLLNGNTSDFYLIPRHTPNRDLYDDLMQLIVKVMIFYLPLLTSQRLFKEMKVKEKDEEEITSALVRGNTYNDEQSSTAGSFGLHSSVGERESREEIN